MVTATTDVFRTDVWDPQGNAPSEHLAAMWGSAESQRGRMQRVLDASRIEEGASVLDWGCGTGVLADLVAGPYLGLDPSPGMVARARRERPWADFGSLQDLAGEFDYVYAIACWGIRPWTEWDTYAEIRKLWEHTTRSFVACLRTSGGQNSEHIGHDMGRLAELAEELASTWSIDRSYHPREALVVLYR